MLIVVTHSLDLAGILQRPIEFRAEQKSAFLASARIINYYRGALAHVARAIGFSKVTRITGGRRSGRRALRRWRPRAVLTGALLVGDSMRGSLRRLLLDQLGQIDEVLVTDPFFRAGAWRAEIARPSVSSGISKGGPGHPRATERSRTQSRRRGPLLGALSREGVSVVGCDGQRSSERAARRSPRAAERRSEIVLSERSGG